MPARPVPDVLKTLRGTDQPSRMNPDAPQPGTERLQFIPEELSETAQKHWGSIRPMLVDLGVAGNTDRGSLMLMCETWATYWEATAQIRKTGLLIKDKHGAPVRNPYLRIQNEASRELLRQFVEFGMTPASRTRIVSTGKKPKKGGEFDDV